jgi:hypothetical protein
MKPCSSHALILCCKSGSFDVRTLLTIRGLSRNAKYAADNALGAKLGSGAASFSGPSPSMAADPCGSIRGLRSFCRALREGAYAPRGPGLREAPALLGGPPLAGPPAQFSLSYDMVLDYRRRCRSVSRCVTALPLARIVELCNIGVRVLLTIRLVGGREAPRRWLSKVGSLAEVALLNLTELYIWGHEAASQQVLGWLVRCGMPNLARFACGCKARFPRNVVGTRDELAAACHDDDYDNNYDYDYGYLLDCLCGTERPALTWLDL